MHIWGPEYFVLLWLQSYNRKYINVPIANESARNCQQRATIIIFRWAPASYHSHKCAGGNRLIEFFSRKFNEIWAHRRAREGKEDESGSKAFWKYFFTMRLWDQEHCCQFIVTKLPKLGNLEYGSLSLLVKVLHTGDNLVLFVDVLFTSHQSRSGSFDGDHAELLLKAHCLVIFWSVIHKTYEDSMQCNQCSFKCQIF